VVRKLALPLFIASPTIILALLIIMSIHLPKTSESEDLKKIRHTTSHVMAMAVQRLFPKALVTIGPWIENGFYYDFDSPDAFTDKDLKAIKKEMIKIINRKLPVIREEVSREDAASRIGAINEPSITSATRAFPKPKPGGISALAPTLTTPAS
jgi:threonyl-tRNA synthetase